MPHLHEAATAERSATEAQAQARDGEMQLSHAERMEVGLLTLSNRERELYLEHFDQQTLSRHTVSLLVAGADRLIDRVKTEGAKGYELALRRTGEIDGPFRLALWLHRRFGWQGPLGDRLADRFETLLVQSVVLEELIEVDGASRRSASPLTGGYTSQQAEGQGESHRHHRDRDREPRAAKNAPRAGTAG